ncbi:GNAT family N-acetyltransferase [Vibrio cholerae]|uniref:GNAT family N-acetyltransferase n=1 Tax=Vibrio cholerae TaxID=666 RepID=UPI003A10086B
MVVEVRRAEPSDAKAIKGIYECPNACTNPRRRHVGTFGMGVKDDVQGLGVGSALLKTVIDLAANWLNLNRIALPVYVDNERAINLYKKFGFVIEGESKAYAFRNGSYVDVYHMARVVAHA